ncbi:MAG: MTH938/NDUFAF3 family protein [Anaerolineae bacterium]|nr:MTH938/NDUFAF3 family protein [Anaerolineae bacterium]
MNPRIDGTKFGSITIDGSKYCYDVAIRLDGKVKKRKKGLSKAVYGTSHKISLDEAKHVYEENARHLIIGAGHYGLVKLSKEAAEFFRQHDCSVEILPMPRAVRSWNKTKRHVIGLFHVTC